MYIPEFLLVLPAKYLKFGPDLSSSHCRQSLSDPSALLLGSPLHQDQRHFSRQLDLVLRMFHAQIEAHSREKPRCRRHARSAEEESHPRAPHRRVGAVRLRFMYVPRSYGRKRGVVKEIKKGYKKVVAIVATTAATAGA